MPESRRWSLRQNALIVAPRFMAYASSVRAAFAPAQLAGQGSVGRQEAASTSATATVLHRTAPLPPEPPTTLYLLH